MKTKEKSTFTAHSINLRKLVPDELMPLKQFVVWCNDEDENGKPEKRPLDAKNLEAASVTSEASWSSFDEVIEVFEDLSSDGISGVGFVLTEDDPYTAIDLDNCINSSGEIRPWAQEIVDRFPTYWERSPSGRGLHAVLRGELRVSSVSVGVETGKIELFSSHHYVTLTGDYLDESHREITDCQAELDELYDQIQTMRRQREATGDPEERRNGQSSRDSERFDLLWKGMWSDAGYPSQSEADLALCRILVSWTGDAERTDVLFRKSKLYREKWDQVHSSDGRTYGEMTIEKALKLAGTNGVNEANKSEPFSRPGHWQRLDVADLTEWECEPVEWIVEKLLPKGRLVFVAGETQTGKTLLWLYLSWAVTRTKPLFKQFTVWPVRRVLYLCLEDPQNRVQSRLMELRSEFQVPLDMGRVVVDFLPGFTLSNGKMFDYLEDEIVLNEFEVVIVDTYQRATTGLSSFDDPNQSPILHRLANLTRRVGTTVVVLDHFRKPRDARRRSWSLDDLKGTGAKAQNADAVILMSREGPILKVNCHSKDTSETVAFALKVAPENSPPPKYKYLGDPSDLASESAGKGDQTRVQILEAMRPGRWYQMSQLVELVGWSRATIVRHLEKLIQEGIVEKEGEYKATRYRRIAHSNDSPEEQE